MPIAKTICVFVPCYNEVENVEPLCNSVLRLFEEKLPDYHCLLQFIDNHSTDGTQELIRRLCKTHSNVRAIINAKNHYGDSAFYGMLQTEGDAVIYLSADFQDPIEAIPELIEKWEQGYAVVAAIRATSKEKKTTQRFRSAFYKIMRGTSDTKLIRNFCNFGIYDRSFIEVLRSIDKPNTSIRGNVAEYGCNIGYISYHQQPRLSGKSHYSFIDLVDISINNFINYSTLFPRLAIIIGVILFIFILLSAFVVVPLSLFGVLNIGILSLSIAIVGMLSISINLFLIGILGENIMVIKKKAIGGPLVVEQERINFQ